MNFATDDLIGWGLVERNLTVPLDSHWRIKSSVENDKEWEKEEGGERHIDRIGVSEEFTLSSFQHENVKYDLKVLTPPPIHLGDCDLSLGSLQTHGTSHNQRTVWPVRPHRFSAALGI